MIAPPDHAVRWHDLECGGYAADLPLWRALAAAAGGPILDVGAGTGRVALHLARRGQEVVAIDLDPLLLEALAERGRDLAAPPETVTADARELSLGRRFGLILVPMQTVQLLGGSAGRGRFLARAREHLEPGGLLALALAETGGAWSAESAGLPPPDLVERDGWVHASQPVAVREEPGRTAIERRRQSVAPDGAHHESTSLVWLDRLAAAELEAEAEAAGLAAGPRRTIGPTAEHVGSEVVVLRG